jgi:6-phosphofructokinase
LHRGPLAGEILNPPRGGSPGEERDRSGLDAVVLIGGEGTFRGAEVFEEEFDVILVGIPGTIDNDVYGTDYCIGFDTAINCALEAIDRVSKMEIQMNFLDR